MGDFKVITSALNDKCNLILKYYEHELSYEPYVDFVTEMQFICTTDSLNDNISHATILTLDNNEFDKLCSIIQDHLRLRTQRRVIKREQRKKNL